MMAEGVVPKHVTSVTAGVYTETGTADVHLAIYAAPSTVGGADGELIVTRDVDDDSLITKSYQEDAAAIGSEAQTLTLTMPIDRAPAVYIVRLWVDAVTGQTLETEDRDADSDETDEPPLPSGVVVTSMVVA